MWCDLSPRFFNFSNEQKTMDPRDNNTDLMDLYKTITTAIEQGVKDLRLIDGEEYQRVSFIRCVNECYKLYGKACDINRRRAICNIYADYCNSAVYPLIEDERERNKKFLKAINNHFA